MESRESLDLDLKRFFLGWKRRWPIAAVVFTTTVTLSVLYTTLIKPTYEAEGKLLFKVPTLNIVGSQENEGDLRSFASNENPLNTQIQIISSPGLVQKTIEALDMKNKEGQPLKVTDFEGSLTVKIVAGTDLLSVQYKSRIPKEAAIVVNKLMAFYIENDIITRRNEAAGNYNFIVAQLPQAQAAVDKADLELRKFKEQNNIVNLAEESKSAIASIGILDGQINTAQAELEQVTAQTDALRNKIGLNAQEALTASSLSQSPAVTGIITQIQEIDLQLANERSRFLDDNPIIIGLEEKKANLNSLLQKQIEQATGSDINVPQSRLQIGELKQNLIADLLNSEVQRAGLVKQVNSFYKNRSAYAQRVKAIPRLEQNQRELENKLEVAQSNYNNLLKTVQELQVAANRSTANARIVAPAQVPEKPVSGKKQLVLVVGVMLGIFLSTSTVLLLEMSDRSLKTIKEIRDIFGYTLLGFIPLMNNKESFMVRNAKVKAPGITVKDSPYSLITEIYRMIMLNAELKYIVSADKHIKIIVITSSVPKEGKSTVSANLAATMAQVGRRVLLIDADMRRPSQHQIWEITNAEGLSEVLMGQRGINAVAEQVMPHLDILAAGAMPPNPLALLDSKRMALLIENCSDKYDFVIIDAPPLLLAADALTLSQMADGIVLVARPEVIDPSSAAAAKEVLERSHGKVLGIVANGINQKNEPNKYKSLFNHAKQYFSEIN